jgi:preprotein translocase subunit SecD
MALTCKVNSIFREKQTIPPLLAQHFAKTAAAAGTCGVLAVALIGLEAVGGLRLFVDDGVGSFR